MAADPDRQWLACRLPHVSTRLLHCCYTCCHYCVPISHTLPLTLDSSSSLFCRSVHSPSAPFPRMDSSEDDDDRRGAVADDSQLDPDDDAMNALLEEEIAAAMQADSNEDEEFKAAISRAVGRGGAADEDDEDGEERKDGSRVGTGARRGINGDLLHLDDEEKGSGARKRPMRDSDDMKAGELDSDLEEDAGRNRAEQPSSVTASRTAATAISAAQLSDARRRNNRENYQRREQRRRQLEVEQSHIRASMTSQAALKRYETFRRARLSHATLKSLVQQCTGSNKVEGQLPAVLSAMGRVYVGVIVEEARRAMRAMGHTGNIRPMHLREAHRRLADRGDILAPHCSDGRRRGIGVAGWHRNGQFFREIG